MSMMLPSAELGQVVIRHAHPRRQKVGTARASSVETRGLRVERQEALTLLIGLGVCFNYKSILSAIINFASIHSHSRSFVEHPYRAYHSILVHCE